MNVLVLSKVKEIIHFQSLLCTAHLRIDPYSTVMEVTVVPFIYINILHHGLCSAICEVSSIIKFTIQVSAEHRGVLLIGLEVYFTFPINYFCIMTCIPIAR
jgi:hypothetical protein